MSETNSDKPHFLSEDSMHALGILAQPFSKTTVPGDLFSSEGIQETLAEFLNTLEDSNALPILIGEKGSGKSSLLSLLIEQSPEHTQYFLVKGSEDFSAFNIFSSMLEAFQESTPSDFQACLDQLTDCLNKLQSQSMRAIILLDDAHLISSVELYQLVSAKLYMQNGAALESFHIALAAAPEFKKMQDQLIPTGTQLTPVNIQIPEFSIAETQAYIEHKLSRAGYLEPIPLDINQLDEIDSQAVGNPAEINFYTTNALNQFSGLPTEDEDDAEYDDEDQVTINYRSLFKSNLFLGIAAAVLIAISTLLFLQDSPPEKPKTNTIISTAPLSALEKNTGGPVRLMLLSEARPSDIIKRVPLKVPQPIITQPAQKTKPIFNKPKPIINKPKPVVPTPKKVTPIVKKEIKIQEKKSVITTNPKSQIILHTNTSAVSDLKSPNWILMQNPKRFTIQLIASTSLKEVEGYLSSGELIAPNSIFSFTRDGEIWYALVHGLFPDYNSANERVKSFSTRIRTNGPWIRQVKTIHASLKGSR